ncbi:hypothetical protein Mulvp2_20 [Enterobacter phage Mulvp2]|nr:hypothetical protein Mulvp2_20 [Enterobacter phage Mulvp2]
MSWIYCKCGQGLDRPTPRQVLLKDYVCPNCGADNNGHVSDGEAVLDLFDSLAPSAPPTLRDQFAMSALQGLLVNNWRSEMNDELFTQRAYRLADAMLEARK